MTEPCSLDASLGPPNHFRSIFPIVFQLAHKLSSAREERTIQLSRQAELQKSIEDEKHGREDTVRLHYTGRFFLSLSFLDARASPPL